MTSVAGGTEFGGLADEAFCYVTTVGRVTGRPHTIEIWFALKGSTLYMLAGGKRRSDWVLNLIATPEVSLRIAEAELTGVARVVTAPEEERSARDLVHGKYQPSYGGDLSDWRENALPVAIDLS